MIAGGGIGGTGIISSGTITAFGSIVVNGTEFDTTNAAIIRNGVEIGVGDEIVLDNLDIGRVVTVEGTGDLDDISAVAVRVTYNDNVRGPVESIHDIDAGTKEIVVLGQIVIINVVTKLKGTEFDTMAQNDVVEVSGLVDDTGATRATFLEKTGEFVPGSNLVVGVTGFILNLDTELKTFEVNNLSVNYSSIDSGDLPQGFADGLLVEVEGTLDAAGGVMLAKSIELGDEIGEGDSDQIEVLGFVTDIVRPSSSRSAIKWCNLMQTPYLLTGQRRIFYPEQNSRLRAAWQTVSLLPRKLNFGVRTRSRWRDSLRISFRPSNLPLGTRWCKRMRRRYLRPGFGYS